MGEIWQSAAMVEVHVREDDMFYIFRLITQPSDLMHGGFLRVKGHPGDETEELREPGGMCIIIQPQACVNESQPLIGFKQQADCTCLPRTRNARITGETVENMNLHEITYNLHYNSPLNAPPDGRSTDGIQLASLGDDDIVRPALRNGRNSFPVADCNSRSDIIPLWDASHACLSTNFSGMRFKI